MRYLTRTIFLLGLLSGIGGVYAHCVGEEEIVFIREYREFGWKKLGPDSVKLSRPLQVLVDFYWLEYHLTTTRLTINKIPDAHSSDRTVLFTTSLSHVQQRRVQRLLHDAKPALMQKQCEADTLIVDDGFHLNIVLTKVDTYRSFSWNGNYVPELIRFTEVLNQASPAKYRFRLPENQ